MAKLLPACKEIGDQNEEIFDLDGSTSLRVLLGAFTNATISMAIYM